MKTIDGSAALACTNRSRTRLAPTPTNISTNSDPLMLKKGTPASPATARPSSVLPVPGGPTSKHPARNSGADLEVLAGVAQEVDDLREIRLRFVGPGHIRKRDLRSIFRVAARLVTSEPEHACLATGGLPAHPDKQRPPATAPADRSSARW